MISGQEESQAEYKADAMLGNLMRAAKIGQAERTLGYQDITYSSPTVSTSYVASSVTI